MWYRVTSRGVQIHIKVVPGAASTQIMGVLGDYLKIRVAAAPEHNKANQALVHFLSEKLHVTPANIIFFAGKHTPKKILLVPVDEGRVQRLVS